MLPDVRSCGWKERLRSGLCTQMGGQTASSKLEAWNVIGIGTFVVDRELIRVLLIMHHDLLH